MKPYSAQQELWPERGRHILAQFDEDSLVVYQAYSRSIGQQVAEHGSFGESFNLDRMSWIKPGFLWMMHRCEWGSTRDQEVVLAIWLRRDAFERMLAMAVHSSFVPEIYGSQEAWQQALAGSEVRIQWDPDHDPRGIKGKRRVIQLGLAGQTLRQYAQEWIAEMQDISGYVREQARYRRDPELLLTPDERIYPVSDLALARRIGIDA